MGAWLTPDAAPGELKCFPVFVPSGMHYEAALRGALLLLTYTANWEKVGTVEPETVAEAFQEGVFKTFDEWSECANVARLIGQVFAYASETAPDGALRCDGAQVAITTYPALYAVVGDAWGAADSGNFRLPNLEARAIIGTGQISGGTLREVGDIGGSESRVISESNLPEHDHPIAISSQNILAGVGQATAVMRSTGSINSGNAGFGTAINIMPPFAAIPYYIWAE